MWHFDAGWPVEAVRWGVPVVASALAVVSDVRSRRIPNLLTGPLLLGGLAFALATGGASGLGGAVLGMLVAGLPFYVLWMVGGGGAGDAKLMLAIGAWVAWPAAVPTLLAVALAGGVVSIAYAVAQRRLVPVLGGTAWSMLSLRYVLRGPGRLEDRRQVLRLGDEGGQTDKRQKVPYALAILTGTCAAAVWVLS